jgi:hypothetical protein
MTANAKLNLTKEEKFKQSMKSWGEDDNRPFIRVKENKEKDEHDYKRKADKIRKQKEEIAAETGDPIERINIIDPLGAVWKVGNGRVLDCQNH